MEAFIVYCSPAGTTRKIAQRISSTLAHCGYDVATYDLAQNLDEATVGYDIKQAHKEHCLVIGSPVYACHPVPIVTQFIAQLPNNADGYAVPFVTWGGVTSGVALFEMAEMLAQKRYAVIGAAKILAVHSLMWSYQHPLGAGHPDEADEKLVDQLVAAVHNSIISKPPLPLDLSTLNYLPEKIREPMRTIDINYARQVLPQKVVNKNRCTTCNICKAICPAHAITCDPFPEFNQNCIMCYSCMQICPESAIEANFSKLETWLTKRAQEFSEHPPSAIFVAHD